MYREEEKKRKKKRVAMMALRSLLSYDVETLPLSDVATVLALATLDITGYLPVSLRIVWRRPAFVAALVLLWCGWVVNKARLLESELGLMGGVDEVWGSTVYPRAQSLFVETRTFLNAFWTMLAAAVAFFAPVVTDLVKAATPLAVRGAELCAQGWNSLSWRARFFTFVALLVAALTVFVWRRARAACVRMRAKLRASKRGACSEVRARAPALLYDAAFVPVAAAMWYATAGVAKPYIVHTIFGATVVLPVVRSALWFWHGGGGAATIAPSTPKRAVQALATARRSRAQQILSFWSAWPLLNSAVLGLSAVSAFGRAQISSAGASSPGAIGAAAVAVARSTLGERVLLLLTAHAMWWGGSAVAVAVFNRLLTSTVGQSSKLVGWLAPKAKDAAVAAAGSMASIENAGTVARIVGLVSSCRSAAMANKGVALAALVAVVGVVVYASYQVLSLLSTAITVAFWWGAAAKSAQTVQQAEQTWSLSLSTRGRGGATRQASKIASAMVDREFEQQIGFWVAAMLIEALCVVPVVGMVVSIWRPVLLPMCIQLGGHVIPPLVNVAGVALTPAKSRRRSAATPSTGQTRAASRAKTAPAADS
jgi:hypothetical protein